MKHLLAALLLAPAILLAQDNPNYDPDYNGDGCFSITDVLGLLPLFGSCVEADTPWACGDSVLFDSYWYETVLIGDQCWFAENLRTTVYANGDSIPAGLTDYEWVYTINGATAIYGEGSSYCDNYSPDIDACDEAQSVMEYGRLYNRHAVDDARSLCPSGWHVPTDGEWTDLENYISLQGFSGTEGAALKSTYGWTEVFYGSNGTDDFGFSALPGGRRRSNGKFYSAGSNGYWWSSSSSAGDAYPRNLYSGSPVIVSFVGNPTPGLSVRCLLDTPLQGCTDSSYIEFNPSAELDDGSCLTLLAPGCTDSLYVEFDPSANVDDGSCLTLAPTEFPCGDSTLYDNYWYETVLIGDQCWFAENLRTTAYANGDSIPAGLADSEWASTTAGATAIFGEGSSLCEEYSPDIDACDEEQSLEAYGRLYNWHSTQDARGLCPTGWHSPTAEEWMSLIGYAESQGFSGLEGTALSSTYGYTLEFGGGNGSDEFGFSALPGGFRDYAEGDFVFAGEVAAFWTSNSQLGKGIAGVTISTSEEFDFISNPPSYGFSVRCLLGAPEFGCTDEAYTEFDSANSVNDGSCSTLVEFGCTDPNYIEFNPSAELDDGSCDTLLAPGCTDSLYVEFDPLANVDDGSCLTLAPTEFACGDSTLFDNYWYATTLIGEQCWFAENLRTQLYANGDSIPTGLTDGEWYSTLAGATNMYGEGNSYCSHNSPDINACDEAQSLAEYGRLYNWYAVDDSRGLCPVGSHVPTNSDWTELKDYVASQGFAGTEGTALKSTSGYYNNGNGTNDFGFSGLPGGGFFFEDEDNSWGYFSEAGADSFWWSSSSNDGNTQCRAVQSWSPYLNSFYMAPWFGLSVRCLLDSE